MSSHTLAVLYLASWAASVLLAAADSQPKPRYTTAYVLRVCVSVFVAVPCVLWLVVRAW